MFDDFLNEAVIDDIKKDYFNFPIVLLKEFLIDDRECLNNIFDFAIYSYLNKEYESDFSQIKEAESFFGVNIGNKRRSFDNGKTLFESIPENLPFIGIRKSIWFDYYTNQKTEYQKVVLLAFIAIKSIVGKKTHCKTNNLLWYSRMEGNSHTVKNVNELSPELSEYFNEYQSKKIKNELILNWNLKHYAYYTRGFYVSFKMTLEDLIFMAEKNRKSRLLKKVKENEKAAIKRAIDRLYKM